MSNEGMLTVNYQNQAPKAVRTVGFILLSLKDPTLTTHIIAGNALRPKQKASVVYQMRSSKSWVAGEMQVAELVVARVVFADRSIWSPPIQNRCRIPVSQP